ncbi:MAG: N-acetyl-alpha-D-glucosaminyl L-malate synthase BshA [Gammaproteobacteria bacterium]|nr:N-acetyl-alpha-D-glucosaminyl L-malate synthase BshA [Gammaproteobacteria bacterium]
MITGTRLKIGITGYPVPGGSGVVAAELGRLLAKRGHEIHFIAYAPPFRTSVFDEKLFFHEVDAARYPLFKYPPYTLTLAAKMAEVSRQFELDILHVHYALPHATAGFLAKSIIGNSERPKLITTLHGTDITLVGSDKSLYDITCFSIRSSDSVTSVSEYLNQATRETFPECSNTEVIPNFVDLTVFHPGTNDKQRARFAEEDEILLVHLSNFRPLKRPVDTVRVLAAVNEKRPARLLLIGDGPEMAEVWQEAERLNLRGRLHVLSNQNHLQELLACCDVFLLPSEEESFGLAALEALACGVPVVSYDVAALDELIINGDNGYRVPLGDINAMANKVLELVLDSEFRSRHRKQARESALRFDADRIIPMYEALYWRTMI